MEEENEIQWEDLAGGWSSVRSPQWLRSKWWSIKRQVSNHKDIPFSGTHTHTFANTIFMARPSIDLPPAGSDVKVPQMNLIYRPSTCLCPSSSSQGPSGTHVVLTDIVRPRKSALFFIAADPTHASGGEQQPRPQLCGLLADSRPDPPADHSPG